MLVNFELFDHVEQNISNLKLLVRTIILLNSNHSRIVLDSKKLLN